MKKVNIKELKMSDVLNSRIFKNALYLTIPVILTVSIMVPVSNNEVVVEPYAIKNNNQKEEGTFIEDDILRSESNPAETDIFFLGSNASYEIITETMMIIPSVMTGNEVYLYVDSAANSLVDFDGLAADYSNLHVYDEHSLGLETEDSYSTKFTSMVNEVSSVTVDDYNLYVNIYFYERDIVGTGALSEIADPERIDTINFISDGYADANMSTNMTNLVWEEYGADPYMPWVTLDDMDYVEDYFVDGVSISYSDTKSLTEILPVLYDIDGDGTQDVFNLGYTAQPYVDNPTRPNPYNVNGSGMWYGNYWLKDNVNVKTGKSGYDYFVQAYGIDSNTYPTSLTDNFIGKTNVIFGGGLAADRVNSDSLAAEAKKIVDSYETAVIENPGENINIIYKGHPRMNIGDSTKNQEDLKLAVESEWISRGNDISTFTWYYYVDEKIPFELMMTLDEFQNDPDTDTYFLYSVSITSTMVGGIYEMRNNDQINHYSASQGQYNSAKSWYGDPSDVIDYDKVIIT